MTDMWAYWLLFLVPAGIAFSPIKGDKLVQHMMWIIVGLLSVLVIGLRYKVGGDWIPYLIYLQNARAGDLETVFLSFTNAVSNGSLYVFLNWVAVQLGLGIYFVNLVCAAITMVGLIKYCQKQPMPWVALTVAMPYMVCIVAMGYTRQAAALGFLLWGLSILRMGNERKFIGLLFLGTLFHLSLMVAWPLIFFSGKKYFWWQYLLFGFFSVYGMYFLLSSFGILELNQAILDYYLYTTRGSFAGAATRVYMNALPVFVSLFFWHRIKRISPDYTVIKCMAIATLLCILLVSVATTLVDRIAVYLMPLQVALWPRLIAVQSTNIMRSVWALMIIIYYGLVLFVWFNYAVHAHLWLPYRMWPFTNEPLYPTFL